MMEQIDAQKVGELSLTVGEALLASGEGYSILLPTLANVTSSMLMNLTLDATGNLTEEGLKQEVDSFAQYLQLVCNAKFEECKERLAALQASGAI
jgi:hypothetical protein